MPEAVVTKTMQEVHPLDHVVWSALTGRQGRFALGNERALRFPAAVAPFAAMVDTDPASFDALRGLIEAEGSAALVTPHEVPVPSGFSVIRHERMLQMAWQGEAVPAGACEQVRLGAGDVPQMLALIAATQPGPFGQRTIELGNYFCVRKQGRLAAMAGERMSADGYTEISAVCVDPAFRGQGHAGGLMKLLIASIRERGETPFLHVLASNQGAIALYRNLGFVVRREMILTVLQ